MDAHESRARHVFDHIGRLYRLPMMMKKMGYSNNDNSVYIVMSKNGEVNSNGDRNNYHFVVVMI